MAGLVVQRGMDANLTAFEHNYGFFNLFNGEGAYDADVILADWDGEMEIPNPGIAIKQYPCCGSAHSAIDAALNIVAKHGLFDPASIALIETKTHERRLAHTNRPEPKTGLDAKFSVQFLTAKTLVDGTIFEAEAEAETQFGRGPKNSMTDAELLEKFTDCVSPVLDGKQAKNLFTAIIELDLDDKLNSIAKANSR